MSLNLRHAPSIDASQRAFLALVALGMLVTLPSGARATESTSAAVSNGKVHVTWAARVRAEGGAFVVARRTGRGASVLVARFPLPESGRFEIDDDVLTSGLQEYDLFYEDAQGRQYRIASKSVRVEILDGLPATPSSGPTLQPALAGRDGVDLARTEASVAFAEPSLSFGGDAPEPATPPPWRS